MGLRDTDLEIGMSRLLQAGIVLAGAVMVAGGALYLARHGAEMASFGRFHGVAPELKTIRGIWNGVLGLQASAIIQMGVLIMIATPVLRVAFAIAGFALERDWLYTGISALVLGLLCYALLGSG